jgi:transposase
MTNYIGLDHHRKFTQVAVVDDTDQVILECRIPNTLEAVESLINRLIGPSKAVVEAGPSWGWIFDTFQQAGIEMILANPMQVRVIAETRCKTDRRDALALARLLRVGWIPRVYVGDAESRIKKQLWRERIWLVRMQVRLKNRIRRLLDHHHVLIPDYTDLFGIAGRTFLEALMLPGKAQMILKTELALLTSYHLHIRQIQACATEATKDLPAVKYLESIPGFGQVFAPIAALEIGEISRFPTAGSLASYCGLIPSVSSSGGLTYRGTTGRSGNHWLKWVFVEAAWSAIRTMPELRLRFQRIKSRRGANIAIVACARHLSEIAFSLLKHQRSYETRSLVVA